MTVVEQPVEVPYDARAEVVSLLNGTDSQPEGEAAVVEQPDEGVKASESDSLPEDLDGDKAEEETPKEGKKPGRAQKTKQRAQAAEAQVKDLTGKVHEALDHVAHFESENTALREELQAAFAVLEENGLGFTPEQLQLREYQAKERFSTHKETAQTAISKREADQALQTSVDDLQSELVEAGEKHGVDWMTIARHMKVHNVNSVEEATLALVAAKPRSISETAAAKQARTNKGAPAVMRAVDGDTAKRDYKPGSREHAVELLQGTGLFQ